MFIGSVGDLEKVDEWRVEVIVPASRARQAVKALIEAHSYEEPAYELIQLVNIQDLPEDPTDLV